jgi:hypothetical protein
LNDDYTEAKLENYMLKGELENSTKNFISMPEEQRCRIIENDSINKRLDTMKE